MRPVIGLDFGTTNSAIAVADAGDEPRSADAGAWVALCFIRQGASGTCLAVFTTFELASHVPSEGSEDDGRSRECVS